MRLPRRIVLLLVALVASPATFAAIGGTAYLRGTVSDFDDRYVFLDAKTERYRIDRKVIPDSADLKPGKVMDFSVPLHSLRVIPLATAPMPDLYHPPRKREPSSN